MPPKKKAAEVRTDVEVEGEALESEFSVSSPASVASTASAMSGASTEFLEKILEANQRSMAALIVALPSMLATPASSATGQTLELTFEPFFLLLMINIHDIAVVLLAKVNLGLLGK